MDAVVGLLDNVFEASVCQTEVLRVCPDALYEAQSSLENFRGPEDLRELPCLLLDQRDSDEQPLCVCTDLELNLVEPPEALEGENALHELSVCWERKPESGELGTPCFGGGSEEPREANSVGVEALEFQTGSSYAI